MSKINKRRIDHMPSRWNCPISDSPSEIERKSGPNGDGNWAGYDEVWCKLQYAAHRMASGATYLSDFHIETMADMGSGHEERMKYRLHLCLIYGWLGGYNGKAY